MKTKELRRTLKLIEWECPDGDHIKIERFKLEDKTWKYWVHAKVILLKKAIN